MLWLILAIVFAEGRKYDVTFNKGIPDKLRKILKKESFLYKQSTGNSMTKRSLSARIHKEELHLKDVAAALGYFSAKIEIKEDIEKTNGQKLDHIKINVKPGPKYLLNQVVFIDWPKEVEEPKHLKKPKHAVGEQIKDYAQRAALFLRTKGYPFAKQNGFLGEIASKNSLNIEITIKPGTKAYFGDEQIKGLEKVDPFFVQRRLCWQKGELYDYSKLIETQQRLLQTGLFSPVNLEPVKLKGKSIVPVKINVEELPRRQISFGARYNTDLGMGLNTGWRHYNLFGGGEELKLGIKLLRRRSRNIVSYGIPDFLKTDQKLIIDATFVEERYRAFHGYSWQTGGKIERNLNKQLLVSLGLRYFRDHFKRHHDLILRQNIIVPLQIIYDKSNDKFNPSKGYRLFLDNDWYHGDNLANILKPKATIYFPLWKDFVLASWFERGWISTFNKNKLPYNRLFYSGGVNSLRGYGFQLAGSLDYDNTPLGGKHISLGGTEIRFPLKKNWNAVTFVEGSKLDRQKSFYGYGAGLRYNSKIGPVRFDVAFPTQRRKVGKKFLDSAYQLYIGFGQAF